MIASDLIAFSIVLYVCSIARINPLIATLKPQNNGPSYSNTVIGTLAVDGCLAVTVENVKKPRFRHELTANDTSKTAKITKR